MTCRELNHFLDDHLAGELPESTRLAFEAHLTGCPQCRAYLRGYRDTIRAARRAFDDPDKQVPASVPDELVRAVRDTRSR